LKFYKRRLRCEWRKGRTSIAEVRVEHEVAGKDGGFASRDERPARIRAILRNASTALQMS